MFVFNILILQSKLIFTLRYITGIHLLASIKVKKDKQTTLL